MTYADFLQSKRLTVPQVGNRYGRLVVNSEAGRSKHGDILLDCDCDCGGSTTVASTNLKSGNTTSCGCFHRERQQQAPLKHGMKGTRVYNAWINMRQRCSNRKRPEWVNYGGRGIQVCERWRDFNNFYADMGEPTSSQTLERIDVNGNYSPENCIWATQDVQARNRRNNVVVNYGGKTQTLVDWSVELGIPYWTLHARFRRGWSVERAFNTRGGAS